VNGSPKPPADEVFVFPATAGQQGFWYLDQLQPGNPAYNIAVRFRLEGPLRVEELRRALNEVVRRHESLRTTFAVVEGAPVQVVSPRLSVPLPLEDLRGVPEADRPERAREAAAEEARRRFDLEKGPLVRARLLRLAEQEHVLLVTVHHVVADGWSVGVLTDELGALYGACCCGDPSPLPKLAIQCGDFAVWQDQWLRSRALDEQLAYWSRQLAHLPTLEVPADRPRPPLQTFRGSIESLLLPKELTGRLAALSDREQVTPFMLMLTAFQALLHRRCGQDDVFVGSVLAGRPRAELEPLIGLFINPVVLRTDLSGDPPFREALGRVRETVLGAFANQDVPFERVVEAAHRKRDPSRHPVFQINFLYQRDFVRPFEAAGLTLTPIPSVSPGSLYDLNFFLVERAEGWRASCEYNTDLYDGATVRRLLGQYQALLEGVAADPGRRLSAFALEAEREVPAAGPGPTATAGAYVAPRDPVEARLAAVWEQALGVERLSVTADFFDAGGHSLLAARLLFQVEKAFGKKLPLATLLQAPTVESFAARLRAEEGAGWADQIHAIQPSGARPPWVVLTSQPQMYRALANHLGPDQPVLGLTSPELAALPEGFTLRDVAANLVAALRTAVPHGPYYLGGWCVLGVVAYEMARQLRAQGEEVALLTLLDSNCPTYVRWYRSFRATPARWYFFAQKVAHHLNVARRLRPSALAAYIGARWRARRERRRDRRRGAAKPRPDAPAEESLQRFTLLQQQAAFRYEPEPTPVPVVLFRSAVLQTGRFRDPQLGWGPLGRGGLTVHELPGDHEDLFCEPAVERLAALLGEALRRAAD
jgi:thioesterase domain-containing protein/acyl carrier protein